MFLAFWGPIPGSARRYFSSPRAIAWRGLRGRRPSGGGRRPQLDERVTLGAALLTIGVLWLATDRSNLPVKIVLGLVQENEVNGRHFTIQDPNGILIDIVQFV